jgi:hypothetical protein
MKKLASFVLTAMFMLCALIGTSACNGHNDDNNNQCCNSGFWGSNWWNNPNGL